MIATLKFTQQQDHVELMPRVHLDRKESILSPLHQAGKVMCREIIKCREERMVNWKSRYQGCRQVRGFLWAAEWEGRGKHGLEAMDQESRLVRGWRRGKTQTKVLGQQGPGTQAMMSQSQKSRSLGKRWAPKRVSVGAVHPTPWPPPSMQAVQGLGLYMIFKQ